MLISKAVQIKKNKLWEAFPIEEIQRSDRTFHWLTY